MQTVNISRRVNDQMTCAATFGQDEQLIALRNISRRVRLLRLRHALCTGAVIAERARRWCRFVSDLGQCLASPEMVSQADATLLPLTELV